MGIKGKGTVRILEQRAQIEKTVNAEGSVAFERKSNS